uniref:AAA-type ATPase N-terminal domain-containing protein n=1 Tax=Cannabis sativa TaxID=3483 RepID=A0A803QM50_CANSA
MPKSDEDDAYMCLKNLVDVIENAKEEAVKKQAEDEEAKLKDKEDEKVKTEKEKLEKENKIVGLVYPYIHITFNEYSGDRFKRSEVYLAIQNYLSTNSTARAKRLKADDVKDTKSLVLTLADNEEVTDDFQGVKLWWTSYKAPQNSTFSWYPNSDEKRYYRLTFHRRHRELITTTYLSHLVQEGKTIAIKNRQRKLYTNGSGESEVYTAIQNYLSANSSSRAKRLRANDIKDNKSLVLSLDDNEEVTEEFQGIKLWWTSSKKIPQGSSNPFYPNSDEKRYFKLTFHRTHRQLITESFLAHASRR